MATDTNAGSAFLSRLVTFNRVAEWLEELELQSDQLALPFIRLTALYRTDPAFPVLQHVLAVAGFWTPKEFVELRQYCGQAMEHDDARARGVYDDIAERIRTWCGLMKIEVRAGLWSVTNARPSENQGVQ